MACGAQRHRKGDQFTPAVNSCDILFNVFVVPFLVPCNKETGDLKCVVLNSVFSQGTGQVLRIFALEAVLCRWVGHGGQRAHRGRTLLSRVS